MYFSNKAKYAGEWSDNLKNGKGIMTDESGSTVYEGTWTAGHMKNGRGLLQL